MTYEEELKNSLMEELDKEMDYQDENPENHMVARKLRIWISNFECEGMGKNDEEYDEDDVDVK